MSQPDQRPLQLQQIPLLEHDPTPRALLNPGGGIRTLKDVPEHCVLTFFGEVIETLRHAERLTTIATIRSEMGILPIYELEHEGQRVAVMQCGVGAPLATFCLEDLIALGGKHVIACGGAGVLDSTIAMGHVLLPTSAVRDEGTSYHYLPPSREVAADPLAVVALEHALHSSAIPYLRTKTWTTDAPYRETSAKIALRRAEGCLAVEMEAAAFFAVAQFRGVAFAQLLYGGDDLGGLQWDSRGWTRSSVREKLFWLAVEACLTL